MGMPKIRHVHGHDQVGMPMDMPTLTCPGMSTGMPGLGGADGALGNWKGATSLAADGGKGKSRGYVLAVLLTAIPFREIVEVHTITIRVDAPHQSYQKLLDSG